MNPESQEKETIQIKFNKELYRNKDWAVLLVSFANNSKNRFKMTGNVPTPMVKSQIYDVDGKWTHNKYGKTFLIDTYEIKVGKSDVDMVEFLSSPLFPGIGKKTAQKILDSYKLDIQAQIELAEDSPEEMKADLNAKNDLFKAILADEDPLIEAIGEAKADMVYGIIKTSEADVRLSKKFTRHNLDQSVLSKMRKEGIYGPEIEKILKNNLYEWSFNNDVLSFNQVDDVVRVFDPESFENDRDKWIILDDLKQSLYRNGDTWINVDDFGYKTRNTMAPNIFVDKLVELQNRHLIKIVDDKITLNSFYEKEKENAEIISNSINAPESFDVETQAMINQAIKDVEHEIGIDFHYDESQRQAIYKFLKNKILVLQGGAGVGKSKVVQGMVRVYQKLTGKKSTLLAPTGKAANRLNEIDNQFSASTIHSFFHETKGTNIIEDDEQKEKEVRNCNVIIVDEASMLDIFTLNMILTKSTFDKLVFVGDINQLPSVNVGDVLWDLNLAEIVPKAYLNTIHRTSSESGIITLANKIKNNEIHELSDLDNIPNVKNYIGKPIMQWAIKYAKFLKKKGTDFDDQQFLAPAYKNDNGVDNLNINIQKLYQPADAYKNGKNYGGYTFMKNDKVLFTKNDRTNGTTNGETGIITSLQMKNKSQIESMTIRSFISGDTIEYVDNDVFDDITLGYACSIHKSQGSEYSEVAVVIDTDGYNYLDKRNIYTAITRSSKNLVLLGQPNDFLQAVQKQPKKRNTFMLEMLQQSR